MPQAETRTTGRDRIHHVVNGHELRGVRCRRGRWTFECPDWPELAREFNGSTAVATIVAAFHARALAQASPWQAADVL